MPNRILVTDRVAPSALALLKTASGISLTKSQSTQPTAEELKGVQGLLIRSRTRVDEALLKAAQDLRVIVSCTSGFDHMDLEACGRWGITVMHTPNANAPTAAQLTMGLALSLVHRVSEAEDRVHSSNWNREGLNSFELQGKLWGIVGLGRIGQRVAELARGFGVELLAFDPYQDESVFLRAGAERVSFVELIMRCDLVSFHVPLTEETRSIWGRGRFESTKPGILLINTSRGSVISEEALCEALQTGLVGGAALDVFEREPLPASSPLWRAPRLLMTPHIGAFSEEAYRKSGEEAALKLIDFFRTGHTEDTLPPKAAWFSFQA